jgi:hypothetical protein
MALTRHSVRTCFLWKGRSDDFGPGTRTQRLWETFLSCLEEIQQPVPETAKGEQPWGVDASVKWFLKGLLEEAADRKKAGELGALLNRYAVIEVLEEWKTGEGGLDAANALTQSTVEKGATAFFLGQLAFVFGRLQLAKSYAIEAYRLLLQASSEEGGKEKSLHLRILEFLTVTLLLEVYFHSQGYDTLRDERGEPQARRIYVELTRDRQAYLQDFPRLEDLGLGIRNGHGAAPESEYIEHFWLPIPTDKDIEPLPLETDRDALSPLALAYVLSRDNRAGMLLFRYRKWREAGEKFDDVRRAIKRQKEVQRWDPVLAPLEHEALLYLGRIKAHTSDFAEAEKFIGIAERYFESIHDEFAECKVRKARAELEYRRFHWA